jgi:hypothetical protein
MSKRCSGWRLGCTAEVQEGGARYCRKCHAAYMRGWRVKQREYLRQLHAIATRIPYVFTGNVEEPDATGQ